MMNKDRLNGRDPGGREASVCQVWDASGWLFDMYFSFTLFLFLFHWITITYQRALRAS